MPPPYDDSWKGLIQVLTDKGFGSPGVVYDNSFKGVVRILQNLGNSDSTAYDYNWRGIIQALQAKGYGAGQNYSASMEGVVRASQSLGDSSPSAYSYNFDGLISAIFAGVSNGITAIPGVYRFLIEDRTRVLRDDKITGGTITSGTTVRYKSRRNLYFLSMFG